MSVETPADADGAYECVYCGCDVRRHDPVSVTEGVDPTGEPSNRYCNYGCLAAHIEDAGLTTGTTCEWSPS
ncbi:hypothetical protein ACFQE8_07610 [Salinirubellus sp. GCM10025818]|mgnify:FL=1|uniref:hypothetical protein n=1 Tax=Salinirubellus TaxID=2162630 RepID=UPI0030CF3EED